jgi:hypothetical protein
MNTTQLISTLTEALNVVPEPDALNYSLVFILNRADCDPSGGIHPLKVLLEQIRNETALNIFDGRMQFVGGSGVRVDYMGLAGWLLRRAAAIGPDQAVANLARYLSSDEIPFSVTWALGGITPQGTGKFGDTLELMPWEQLPDSKSKQDFANQIFSNFHHPSAALVRPLLIPRSQLHPDLSNAPVHPKPQDETDVHDAILCAGLIGPVAPTILASTTVPAEWAPVFVRASNAIPGKD